jgi:predicted PurR-regulated permease PerM
MTGHSPSDAPRSHDAWRQRMFLTVATVAALVLVLLFLWYAVQVLLIVFAGILLAVVLRSLADLLSEYTGIGRGWALGMVVLLLLALFGGGGWLLAPQISEQGSQLVVAIPEAIDEVESWVERQSWGERLMRQRPDGDDLLGTGLGSLLAQAGGIFSTTLGVIVEVFVVLFLGIYLAINPQKYANGVVRLVPIHRRERAREVLYALGFTLKWFMLGRLIAMVAVGIVTTIGLMLLGVPLALVFGVITTLLTFVPYIGPIASAILPALIALTVSPSLALYVLLLYLVVQNLEGYLLTPLIMQGVVSVPPALTIIAEVLGGILFGVLGIILATPFVAVAIVLIKMLYVEDVLGDEEVEVVPEARARESLRQEQEREERPQRGEEPA